MPQNNSTSMPQLKEKPKSVCSLHAAFLALHDFSETQENRKDVENHESFNAEIHVPHI